MPVSWFVPVQPQRRGRGEGDPATSSIGTAGLPKMSQKQLHCLILNPKAPAEEHDSMWHCLKHRDIKTMGPPSNKYLVLIRSLKKIKQVLTTGSCFQGKILGKVITQMNLRKIPFPHPNPFWWCHQKLKPWSDKIRRQGHGQWPWPLPGKILFGAYSILYSQGPRKCWFLLPSNSAS